MQKIRERNDRIKENLKRKKGKDMRKVTEIREGREKEMDFGNRL